MVDVEFGSILFTSGTPATQLLSPRRDAVGRLLIQNRTVDDDGNATAGNTVLIGLLDSEKIELVAGAAVELLDVRPREIHVRLLGTLTAGQKVVVSWVAHGRPSS